jgi:hypothetical protein
MGKFNKKKGKKIDLLEMPDYERIKFIRELNENLRQKAVEAKLWQMLVQTEKLTVNGQEIHCEAVQLRGISLSDLIRSK